LLHLVGDLFELPNTYFSLMQKKETGTICTSLRMPCW